MMPLAAITELLEYLGEDPTRDGLLDTPRRVCRSLAELTAGYHEDPAAVLGPAFDVPHDAMVVVRGIRFTSLCEHHMLPFVGTADIGYLPGGRLLGLSKLARLLNVYARRLQVQERLTLQVAEALMEHGQAKGVGVIVRAVHSCMGCRGVRQPDAETVTSALLGAVREDADARAEFLTLCKA